MKDKQITKPQYKIEIEFISNFIFLKRKKYCIYKYCKVQKFSDPSYGNGGGSYNPTVEQKRLITYFDTFMEADSLKIEMEKYEKI
jgi:hypothetical protein